MTPFHFTDRMRDICSDMVARLPDLAHIDMSRVAVAFSQARKRVAHGLYAKLTPMRFEDGALTTLRQGRKYTVERLFDRDGREQLYILSFYLPRFLDTHFEEKLVTILHELWHISPQFDGDLRRFPGRCYAHSGSQAAYDREMLRLARHWLTLEPPESLYDFLHLNFAALRSRYPRIHGVRIRHPKLVEC